MQQTTLFTLFLLGFFGGTHCVGMCGGLSSAFALQLPPHISRIQLIFILNMGRLIGYVLIGALMGALSQMGNLLNATHHWQQGLFILSNILLLLMGLYLAGLGAWASKIELIGKPIWRKLNPYLNKLLPIRSLPASLMVGMIWGWLPCGLVYNASLYALSSGSWQQGALYLLAFGVGTLPNLLAMGWFATQLRGVLQNPTWRLLTGLWVSIWACWQLGTYFQAA